MSFLAELRRRNVVRVGIAYMAAAWLVIQAADTLFPVLRLPDWGIRFVLGLLALGLPIALIVAWVYELTPEGLKKTGEAAPEPASAGAAGRRFDRAIIVVLALAVVFLVLDNYVLDDSAAPPADARAVPADAVRVPQSVSAQTDSAASVDAAASATSGSAPTGEPADTPLPRSIAVLPFANLSPDEANAYFAVGLHDEILNQLFKLSNLSVISRTSVVRYANSELSAPQIARELNVTAVMEGTVRYAGDQIRVTVQLIDGETDQHIWSDTYTEQFEDIFAIESDIAMNVANALNAAFSPEEQAAIERVPTVSPAAYSLYLQARTAFASGGAYSDIVTLLDRAIETDEDFAGAIGMYAWIRANELTNTATSSIVANGDLAAVEQEVRDFVARALALDPSNVEARMALRTVDVRRWRWSDFLASVQPVDEPRLLAVQQWVFAWMNRPDEAVRIGELAVAHDPNLPGPYISLGVSRSYRGDYVAADEMFTRAAELLPVFPLTRSWIAYNNIARGEYDAALDALQLTEELLGANRQLAFLPELAYGYAVIGRRADAERIFAEIQSLANPELLGAGGLGMAYLAVDDPERALEQLEIVAERARNQEFEPGFLAAMNLRMNFLNDPRLQEPPFVDVLGRMRGD